MGGRVKRVAKANKLTSSRDARGRELRVREPSRRFRPVPQPPPPVPIVDFPLDAVARRP